MVSFVSFCRATSFVVSFVLALNKVNIVAVTTMLVLHVGNGRSEHVRSDIMFLAIIVNISVNDFNIIKSTSDALDGLPGAD